MQLLDVEFNTKFNELINNVNELISLRQEKVNQINATSIEVAQNIETLKNTSLAELDEKLATAKAELMTLSVNKQFFTYLENKNPTKDTNPVVANATWFNTATGECFTCKDNTLNENIWLGSNGTLISVNVPPTAPDVSDFISTISSNDSFTYTPKGAIDTDNGVAKYEIVSIVPELLEVNSFIVNVGESFTFNSLSCKSETNVSVSIRAIDSLGLAGKTSTATLTIKPCFAGEIGGYGAGVGVNHTLALKCNLTPLIGCDDPKHENFGNYQDEHGSIFVCIPKFYYKINNDVIVPELAPRREVLVSYEPKAGFVIPYGFKKMDGSYVDCVFVSKYQLSNSLGVDVNGGVAVSKKGLCPVTTATHNVISHLKTTPTNDNNGWFKAVRSAGEEYCMHYAPLRFAYWLLCEAHIQACVKKYSSLAAVPAEICAFLDVAPYYPKGNNNGAFKDCNDTSVTYATSGYSGKALAGAITNFNKTTHNGQACGIADLNGNLWEVDAGWLNYGGSFYVLKGIDALKVLDETNKEDLGFYTSFSMPNRLANDVSNYRIGNGKNAIFSGATSGDDYLADNVLRTLDASRNSAGLEAYGNDYQYLFPASQFPVFGGYWGYAALAGILTAIGSGTWGNGCHYLGVRALLIP